ncbi:hypothetical protein [Acidithiobacillus albertensis]|uniref:hypothetical protein n=1 Tax=Acidithiobacillus albertensis TaxID=119978 RepID=UPI00094AAFDC|nr:hypothetical protein [Acidithiobacillus albertensis]
MIIKNKPFHILSAQCVQCAFYFPAAVLGCAVLPFGVCDAGHVRRWPCFLHLEAYKSRLSGYLVRNWLDLEFYRMMDAYVDDSLMVAGGVW